MLSTYATTLLALFAVAAPAMAATPQGGPLGSRCKYSNSCTEVPTGARPSCNSKGRCDFVCLNSPILVKNAAGNGCVPNSKLAKQCNRASDCQGKTRLPSNAVDVCLYNQCTYQCGDGYHKIAGRCYKDEGTCGGNTCAPIDNGSTFCDANQECVYRCQQAEGFTLYTNSDKSAYRCVNTGNDAANCGAVGNVCQGGYNGVGTPVCLSGTCSVNCPSGTTRTANNQGQYYCARN